MLLLNDKMSLKSSKMIFIHLNLYHQYSVRQEVCIGPSLGF
jgi:hypothetical protein